MFNILQPLNDVTNVTWSIVWSLLLVLLGTIYCIAYILRLSYKELQEDGQVREQGQEGSIEAESRERDCEESKEWR
jgi:hypothetical protein